MCWLLLNVPPHRPPRFISSGYAWVGIFPIIALMATIPAIVFGFKACNGWVYPETANTAAVVRKKWHVRESCVRFRCVLLYFVNVPSVVVSAATRHAMGRNREGGVFDWSKAFLSCSAKFDRTDRRSAARYSRKDPTANRL